MRWKPPHCSTPPCKISVARNFFLGVPITFKRKGAAYENQSHDICCHCLASSLYKGAARKADEPSWARSRSRRPGFGQCLCGCQNQGSGATTGIQSGSFAKRGRHHNAGYVGAAQRPDSRHNCPVAAGGRLECDQLLRIGSGRLSRSFSPLPPGGLSRKNRAISLGASILSTHSSRLSSRLKQLF